LNGADGRSRSFDGRPRPPTHEPFTCNSLPCPPTHTCVTPDTELLLQKLTLFVWGAHALTGVAAAGLASATRGRSRAGAVLKVCLWLGQVAGSCAE
jgi:hypothetical protein